MKHKNNYWTKEKCQSVALKYNNRNEFRKNDASAYRTSIRHKWLDELCSHMLYINKYWNDESCKLEALKYKHRKEFQIKSKGAYEYSKRHNILNDVCSHMIKIGSREFRCVYIFVFDDNCVYIGLTYNIQEREYNHNRKGPVFKHIKKTNSKYKLIQLTDYISKKDAQIFEEQTINEYGKKNYHLLNTNRYSTLGGSILYWTYERCKIEALKYNSRKVFHINNRGAYESSRKHQWLNDICSHMTFNKRK
jgi:predicted GIY-YIG superfamily endonuclease